MQLKVEQKFSAQELVPPNSSEKYASDYIEITLFKCVTVCSKENDCTKNSPVDRCGKRLWHRCHRHDHCRIERTE